MKSEATFQRELIDTLHSRLPGCIVMKNGADCKQGIPDLTVLYKDRWATLECKKNAKEADDKHRRKNQEYYVNLMNEMSFSRFIYPENREQVLHELETEFRV